MRSTAATPKIDPSELASDLGGLSTGEAPLDWGQWIEIISRHVQIWSAGRKLSESQAAFVLAGVLQCAFPASLLLDRGEARQAAEWLTRMWQEYASKAVELRPEADANQAALSYDVALCGSLIATQKAAQARHILQHLMTVFGFSQDELGRVFSVSGETIRRWERRITDVPDGRMAEIISTHEAASRLGLLFVPDRLPQVIRRKAELFGGERALDWIQRGRIAEVAERYEAALVYQA